MTSPYAQLSGDRDQPIANAPHEPGENDVAVFAQAAIQEPGLFAFYHPNLDVLNGGAPTPAARLETQAQPQWRVGQAGHAGHVSQPFH